MSEKQSNQIKKAINKDTANRSLSVLATVAIILSCLSISLAYVAYNRYATPIAFPNSSDGNSINFVEGSMAEVAAKVSPAVVSIKIVITNSTEFYGHSYSYDSSSSGTGFVVSQDGYIITNKHVVDDATTINVVFEDGTTYENARLIATDPLNDVAFIKIDGVDNLPFLAIGDSKTLSVGQQVLAVGNTLGEYQNTVSYGIISGLGRTVNATDKSTSTSERLIDLIQTDS